MKISDLVKSKRKLLGESQSDFGKRFGVSHAAISDMESGKTKSIDEEMLNFLFPTCEHREREYRTITYVKCIKCGYETEENMKFKDK